MKYGVGIDISKGKSTIAILSITGEVIEEPFEINHDINGLNLLEEKIKDIPKEDLKIVMEETGTYHLPILGYLLDKGYFVVAENALKIKKYLDRGLRKAKTDKKAKAEQIAELKQELASTDYQIIKCSECQLLGQDIPYDVAELHEQRQAIRDKINKLEE